MKKQTKAIGKKKKAPIIQNRESRRGKNPASLANLKPFEPGHSGNPGGRPKVLSEAYRAKLARIVPDDPEGRTYAEVMADSIALEVIKGDVAAAREIRSATEGDKVVFEDAWKREVIELLKAGRISPQDVIEALGIDDARSIIIAAGAAIPASASEQQSASADHSASA